jgi:5-methylcytosine-specific restriction endonuclease McrA
MNYTRQHAYHEYLKSEDWAWVKEQCRKRDKGCQKCGKTYHPGLSFDVHHKHYRYVGQGDLYELESVVLLCRDCHRRIHNLPAGMAKIESDLEKWFADWDAGRR